MRTVERWNPTQLGDVRQVITSALVVNKNWNIQVEEQLYSRCSDADGEDRMNTGAVEYFDERKGFWRLGYLEKTDRKWAWVRS